MNAIKAAFYEKWVEFRNQFWGITLSGIIGPLMYMVAFGLGISGNTPGYMTFLLPGIIALTTMSSSFNAVAQQLNIQRLYEYSFDQIIISPVSINLYFMGQTLTGALRGMYSGVLIWLTGMLFGIMIPITPLFVLVAFLNCMTFASLGVTAAIMARTCAGVSQFSMFAIMPMTFLCGTFFSLDRLPRAISVIIGALPLSQASSMLRAISQREPIQWYGIPILLVYLAAFIILGNEYVRRKSNL